MKSKKWLAAACLLPVLACPMMPLQAAHQLPYEKIVLEPADAGPMTGRTFVIYKIFSAEYGQNKESVHYSYVSQTKAAVSKVIASRLKTTASSLSQEQAADYMRALGTAKEGELEEDTSAYRRFVEELRDELKKTGTPVKRMTVEQTNPDGSADIAGLDDGYYIIDEIRSGTSQPGAASLCLALSTDAQDAVVRLKGDYPQLSKQILEDDGNAGWNDIGDYCIGQNVPYRYQSAIPQISAYQTYYFAMHDKMDPVLDFEADSLSVTLSDNAKTYTLKPEEFRIDLGKSGEETFAIVIEDLKAIADREFYGGDAQSVHEYGQSISVHYNAVLSERARGAEGQPGFENTVRLEFSNDPDSDGIGNRGFTPWDTVVCFTYRVEGIKHNEKGKNLPGARFRLFADEDCRQEILVRASQSEYAVMHADYLDDHPEAARESCDIVSNDKGMFNITGLDSGVYYLQEVKAPTGYRKIDGLIRLSIEPEYPDDRHSYQAGQAAGKNFYKHFYAYASLISPDHQPAGQPEALSISPEDGSCLLNVLNTTDLPLPLTGSSASLLLLGGGAALIIAGMRMIRKNSDEEKKS